MNSRNFQSILSLSLIFWALFMFNISCHPSFAQGNRDLEASGQRGGKRVQSNLRERYSQLLREMKSKGYDVSEAIALNEKAKRAAKEGNRQEARQFLEQAISKLESLEAGAIRAPQQSSDRETGKTVQIELPVKSKVRVVETFPWDTNTVSSNTLKNFHYSELEPKDGVVLLSINAPVIVQEYPYTDFKFKNNKAFGATEASEGIIGLSTTEINSRLDTILKIISQAGIGLARDFRAFDTRRSNIEDGQGTYDFSRSDYAVNAAINNGIDFIGRLTPHRVRKKGGPPEDESAYIDYIKKTVKRYKGRVKYWQTLKEPEPRVRRKVAGNDGGLSPEEAVRIFMLSYNTIKSVDENAIVYFPGPGPGFEFGGYNADSYFEKIISLGGAKYFDIMGFDAYKRDIEEQAKKYRDILKKYGYDKPLWVAQTGAPDAYFESFPRGGSPMAQCEYMVKAYAIAFAIGIEKVFWGEFLDESLNKGKELDSKSLMWDATGLFYTGTWRMKPGYFTHRLLATALNDFTKAEKLAPNIVKFTFASKSPVYIVWPN
jgi:hypothetical protein